MRATLEAKTIWYSKRLFGKNNMIEKVVTKKKINDLSLMKDDLAYWLSKKPEERVAAVDYLRRQYHGSSTGLQRTARIVQRKQR